MSDKSYSRVDLRNVAKTWFRNGLRSMGREKDKISKDVPEFLDRSLKTYMRLIASRINERYTTSNSVSPEDLRDIIRQIQHGEGYGEEDG